MVSDTLKGASKALITTNYTLTGPAIHSRGLRYILRMSGDALTKSSGTLVVAPQCRDALTTPAVHSQIRGDTQEAYGTLAGSAIHSALRHLSQCGTSRSLFTSVRWSPPIREAPGSTHARQCKQRHEALSPLNSRGLRPP